MLILLTRYWWLLAVRGFLALAFGVLAILWPKDALELLFLFVATYAFVDGLFTLIATVATTGIRSWAPLLEALLGIACAVAIALWPRQSLATLVLVVAMWAIATGVLELAIGFQLRRELKGELWMALAGAVSMVFGAVLLARPNTGVIVLAWLVGWYATLFGALFIALAIRLRRLSRHHVPFDSLPGYV